MSLVIPGHPNPTPAQVRLFQANNRCVVDGIVGPETLGACWRPEGNKRYTHLAPHRVKRGGADDSAALAARMVRGMDLPIDAEHVCTLLAVISSDWSTGLDYLSTQDGITMGFRRYAGGKLARLLRSVGVPIDARRIPGPNNGYPLDRPALRRGLLAVASDPAWWRAQLRQYVGELAGHLERHDIRDGRGIALFERVNNSAPGWTRGCSSFEDLAAVYVLKKGRRGRDRIKRIERRIPAGEPWR